MSRLTAIISAVVICLVVCLGWLAMHYHNVLLSRKPEPMAPNSRQTQLRRLHPTF